MSDIVVSVKGADYTQWFDDVQKAVANDEPWVYSMSYKPPPLSAGDRVYVCARGKVQAYGIVADFKRGEVDYTIDGVARTPWIAWMAGWYPVDPAPTWRPLSTWVHAVTAGLTRGETVPA